MTIHLDQETQQRIDEELRSGRYSSASEVVRDALQLVAERNQLLLSRKDEIGQQIAKGLQSLRLGQGVDGEAVFDRIEAELDLVEARRSGK
jgi:antitoxin ParD1/3/4